MPASPDVVWKALADPHRRAILDRLRDGPKTTGAICEPFAQTRFGVMKHLDALETAGLIVVERRGRERWNYLNGNALEAALARWLTPFQRAWANRLSDLAAHLEKENAMSDPESLFLDIRQEVALPASPARVFAALTRDIGQWWTPPFRQAAPGGQLRLGAEIDAPMIETGHDGHEVIWGRVEEVRAPDRLYISGRFGMVGAVAGRVHFDLAADGAEACRLVVSHQALGRISANARASFTEGWHELLDRRLRAYLTGANHD